MHSQNQRRDLARTVGLGRLAYLVWHAPAAWAARMRREGGPIQQWITARGRAAMRRAAPGISPCRLPDRKSEEAQLVFLTGRTLWYQTAFCLHSLLRQTEARLPVRFLSDGTLRPEHASTLLRLFPGSVYEPEEAVSAALDRRLPRAAFPTLRAHERKLVLMRKFTHVHGAGTGWQLFLDSDMLFYAAPCLIESWAAAPDRPIFMTDLQNAYGYPLAVLSELAGAAVPEHVNTGVSGLRADTVDWAAQERWLHALLADHGSSYYVEQAMFALYLAGRPFLRLPAQDYRLMPDEAECLHPTACLHHYVAGSKREYFRQAWRQVLH